MTNKKKTKTQELGNAVRVVADAFMHGRKKVSKLSPGKHGQNTLRVSGAVLLALAETLTRLFNVVFVDNVALRWGIKKPNKQSIRLIVLRT